MLATFAAGKRIEGDGVIAESFTALNNRVSYYLEEIAEPITRWSCSDKELNEILRLEKANRKELAAYALGAIGGNIPQSAREKAQARIAAMD